MPAPVSARCGAPHDHWRPGFVEKPKLFFRCSSPHTLEEVLRQPYEQFVEVGDKSGALRLPAGHAYDFSLSISTLGACRCGVAKNVTAALAERALVPGALHARVETALHEAVSNAVIHGNLDLPRAFGSLEEFDSYAQIMEKRLADAYYTTRRIQLSACRKDRLLCVHLQDEGQGVRGKEAAAENPALPYGRGLSVIRHFTSELHIDFHRHALELIFRW